MIPRCGQTDRRAVATRELTAESVSSPGEVDFSAGDAEVREAVEEVADDGRRVRVVTERTRRDGDAVRIHATIVQLDRHHLQRAQPSPLSRTQEFVSGIEI